MLALTTILIALVTGLVGASIGRRSGRPCTGFIWGLLLGPVGWLVTALEAGTQRLQRPRR